MKEMGLEGTKQVLVHMEIGMETKFEKLKSRERKRVKTNDIQNKLFYFQINNN